MIPRPCAILFNLVVCALLLDSTASFVLEPSSSLGISSQSRVHTATGSLVATKPSFATSLFAKKVRKSSGSSSNDKKTAPATGGFGSPSAAAVSASSSQGKSRGISGRAVGAGSKPLRQAATTFDSLRKEQGASACHDIYIRSPDDSRTTFWFVGKIARNIESDKHYIPTPAEAVLSQKRIILEYAKQHLRPQNFGGKYALNLELWLAPADSEMDVVQQKVSLEHVKGSVADLSDDFSVLAVGFNPEIYVGDELNKGGLRVELDEEGRPTKPVFEVNNSA
jgi:hypothetical protein